MGKVRLCLDIGSNSLQIVVPQGAGFQIEEVKLPEGMVDEAGAMVLPHAFAQFLKQTKKELGLPSGPVALVLPASQIICKLVNMPNITEAQVMMNLPYEFSEFVQGAADLYKYDYAVCDKLPDEEGIPMMAAVALKDTLAGYTKVFAQAGMRLQTVLPQEMALIQLCRTKGGDSEEFCFVDLGHQCTRITVVYKDRIRASRQITIGGRDLDRVIANEAGVSQFLANTHKMSNFHNVLGIPAVVEICDRIAVEILKVVNFYNFTYRDNALRGVYLVGGGTRLDCLTQSIARTVGVPLLELEDLVWNSGYEAAVFAIGAAMGGA